MRASWFMLCAASACTCDPSADQHVYACTGSSECADGWECVDGRCAQSGQAGGTGTAGGGTGSNLPQNVSPPTLIADGGFRSGALVTADDGTWAANSADPITTTRRWLRCDSDGGACTPLTTTASFTGSDVQTDATRAAATAGDGRLNDSSVGTWAAATNVVPNGGLETNNAQWGSYTSSGNPANYPTIARDTAQHAFGAASLRVTTNGAELRQVAVGFVPVVAASTPYAVSAWVRAPAGAGLCIGVDEFDSAFNYLDSFPGRGTLTADGTWQRLSYASSTHSTTQALHVLVGTCGTSGQAITFHLDGVQAEVGTAPTPYVETNGATAQRADSSLTGPTSLLALDVGWAAFRLRPQWTAATTNLQYPSLLLAGPTSVTDKLHVYYYPADGSWGLERNNGAQNPVRMAHAPSAGTSETVVAAWTASQLKLSVNGAGFATASFSQIPTGLPATFDLGALDGELLWVALGAGTLDDAQAAALHALGDADPTFPALPPSATLLWPADTLAYAAAVGGAATYTPSAADVGFTLRLAVTATNANGSATATSAAYGPVSP